MSAEGEHGWPAPAAVLARVAASGQGTLAGTWPAPPRIGLFTTTRPFIVDDENADAGARAGAAERHLTTHLPAAPVWLRQVHGNHVVVLDEATLATARAALPVADAVVTRLSGVMCAVRTADCVPVAITDVAGTAIGLAHAGWRGMAAGVLEATVRALVAQGAAPRALLAWLGPAIGPASFEVGDDVKHAFCVEDAGAAACFAPHREDKWLADLYGLARRRLVRVGVTAVYGGGFCTYADVRRFPSYRRERTGERMATLLWRTPEHGASPL